MATPVSPAAVTGFGLSSNPEANALLNELGYKWAGSGAGTSLTYSFRSNTSHYSSSEYAFRGEPWAPGAFALSEANKAAVRSALQDWSEVANIGFTEVADSATVAGDLRFGFTAVDEPAWIAWAYLPYPNAIAGDVWFENGMARSMAGGPAPGSRDYLTVLHEIGHALGLKHSHDGAATLSGARDHYAYTVMSYSDHPAGSLAGAGSYAHTPMLLDIAAIQHLYGANMATRSGDTTYSWARGERIFETLWDGGGIDTLDWSNQSSAARIDLNAGAWSQLGPARGSPQSRDTLAISYGVVIEKAKGGAGNDTLIGNSAGNTLDGGRGNDFLSGGAGDDWFLISAGRDTIEGGAGFDTVDFTSQSRNGLAVNLAGYREVEAFVGGNGGERVTGTAAAERLESRGGNDTLAGGGGNDTLSGGAGRDSFDFLAAPGSANADRILDFASRSDKIRLDDAVHARLGSSGNFSSNDARFWAATGASRGHDASDRVIYDTSSGNLYYDADGSGGGAAFLVATLQGTPGLTASDIAVV